MYNWRAFYLGPSLTAQGVCGRHVEQDYRCITRSLVGAPWALEIRYPILRRRAETTPVLHIFSWTLAGHKPSHAFCTSLILRKMYLDCLQRMFIVVLLHALSIQPLSRRGHGLRPIPWSCFIRYLLATQHLPQTQLHT